MKIEIKCRYTDEVLFEHTAENNTMLLTLQAAVAAHADLAGANLDGAILDGVNFSGANIFGAHLDVASLAGANLTRAILGGASLAEANLAGTCLAGASLGGANLAGAILAGANLDDGSFLIGERPIFQFGPIGSRCAYFVAYITDKGLRLRTGCFFGTREEFEEKLSATHAGNSHEHEYRAALLMIDAHAKIWTPAEAA
jgi:uncharacterized protein YjbI with pentapeptide repeats